MIITQLFNQLIKQKLICDYFLLFLVLYNCKLNIFEIFDKTSTFKRSQWAVGTFNVHILLFLIFYRLNGLSVKNFEGRVTEHIKP